ncbi:hypothetical protein MBLNU230_g3197t1 [Neophaeotheca triangularis]
MAQYVYKALDENKQEIRLMTILPALCQEDELVCILSHARLTQTDVPTFEALSYTWGDDTNPSRLRLSSSRDEGIDVTRNLREALPYLRYTDKPRVMWIDAVCINQQDKSERGQQVQRMGHIYTLAERVVIWLGVGDFSSQLIMETCKELNCKVNTNIDGYGTIKSRTQNPLEAHWGDKHVPLPYHLRTYQALADFLRRPWFHRLWIWQEVRLANPTAIIACGTDTMPWRSLRTMLGCLVYKRTSFDSIGVNDLGALVRNGFDLSATFGYISLKRLLTLMRHAQCTNSRDRVYGILELSTNTDAALDIRPDYGKSVPEVYKDLMTAYMAKSQRLELLSLCELNKAPRNWPSWVPYLDAPKSTRHLTHAHSSGHSICDAERLENGSLKLAGVIVSQVAAADDLNHDVTDGQSASRPASYETLIAAIRRWLAWLDMNADYIDGSRMAEAFCRAICAPVSLTHTYRLIHRSQAWNRRLRF